MICVAVSRGTAVTARAGSRKVGAPGRLKIWHPFEPILFQFSISEWAGEIFEKNAQIAGNFRRNSFACVNLSFPATHFWLFECRLSVLYSLGSRASARPARMSRHSYRPAMPFAARYASVSTSQCEFVLIHPLGLFFLNKSKGKEGSPYILKIFVLRYEKCCIPRHMYKRFKFKVINFMNDDHCTTWPTYC